MRNPAILVLLGLLLGVSQPARAAKPVSAEQIQLCYELGERGLFYEECNTDAYVQFVNTCSLRPAVTIDPAVLKLMHYGVTALVDNVLAPLVSQCDPAFYGRARAMIRSKVKGIHVKIVPVPKPNEAGNYPRSYAFENGIFEIGTFALPGRDENYSDPEMAAWVWEKVLGNPNGTESARDDAALKTQVDEPLSEPPLPTPEQKKRIAKLLTRKAGGGPPNQCLPQGYGCFVGHGSACCNGACYPVDAHFGRCP